MSEQKRLRTRLETIRSQLGELVDALATGEHGATVAARVTSSSSPTSAWDWQENAAEARTKATQVVTRLREMKSWKAAKIVESSVDETLSHCKSPEPHWRLIDTNNPLERIACSCGFAATGVSKAMIEKLLKSKVHPRGLRPRRVRGLGIPVGDPAAVSDSAVTSCLNM